MSSIRICNVVKTFREQSRIIKALDNINLTIKSGEILTILGPTACGKTTLLNVIAGIESVDSGVVYLDNNPITDLPPKAKETSTVFGDYIAYREKKTGGSLLLYFKFRQWLGNIDQSKVAVTSKIMGIDENSLKGLMSRRASKGQQQRLDLARYIITKRAVFLFDNPFISLDVDLRHKTRRDLKELLDYFKPTTILVTDDLQESEFFGQRIALMEKGKIIQDGTFSELIKNPDNKKILGMFSRKGFYN